MNVRILFRVLILLAFTALLSNCSLNSDNKEDDYRIAVADNDFQKAHQIVGKIHSDFMNTWEKEYPNMNLKRRAVVEAAAEKYAAAVKFVYCSEARYIIAEDIDCCKRISFLISEVTCIGERLRPGTYLYFDGDFQDMATDCAQFNCYRLYTECVNELCNTVMDLAIASKNKELAGVALSHYVENCYLNGQTVKSAEYHFLDRENAQEKFEEAEANGIFDPAE